MVRLAEHKELTENKAIQNAKLTVKVYIPLVQHFGRPCDKILVKPNDLVKTGQMIATSESGLFSPVHASASGKVSVITDWLHPVLGRAKAVIIESDGRDEKNYNEPAARKEIDAYSAEKIREIIFNAGIVGMGGAGFPTHIKLKPSKPVDTFILNGAECEPYLTTDHRLMVEHANEIIEGAKIVLKVLGIDNCIVAIEDNKPEAVEIFKKHLPAGFKLKILKTYYPQGGEKQLIKEILNKEVPSGGLPFDIGVVVQNVATVFAIYEAVDKNKPLYERVVSVTGSCIENPGNFLVRIGTTVRDLIQECGGFKKEPAKVVFGGPMMGIAQFSLDVPVIKTTSGIVFFSKEELVVREDRVCCRCARCIDVCPARIMPAIITMAAEKERWDIAKDYDALDCIECGLCSYICPAKRDLVHLIKYAKSRIKK
ncbi:MAG: electron transport complex subunit RsxC [Candidatus Omnitrophica bacterium]|nr:electron transport complex subunit RsxC [Candidatus Omnitrophota bacterium]MDD5352934.1 electron transport complex subunit RsxC [Candidatus Omnitrophota bacterium]MDD5550533.1 electron transport complex subunit RsxC [Candidatus Omnitrophota bacterium]